jgi:hypothetical protein
MQKLQSVISSQSQLLSAKTSFSPNRSEARSKVTRHIPVANETIGETSPNGATSPAKQDREDASQKAGLENPAIHSTVQPCGETNIGQYNKTSAALRSITDLCALRRRTEEAHSTLSTHAGGLFCQMEIFPLVP